MTLSCARRNIKKLPAVLSRDEILAILNSIENIKHRTVLLTAYSSSLRISEVLNLRLTDIDSKSKTIKVRGGKGGKDRFTILGEENLAALRHYWKLYSNRPKRKQALKNPLPSIPFGIALPHIFWKTILIPCFIQYL